MPVALSSLSDAPVLNGQERIGTVVRVVFDCTNGHILGITLNADTVAYADAITALDAEHVAVRETEAVRPGSLVARAVAAPIHLLGATVTAEDGTPMGHISDAAVVFPALQLHSIVAHSEDGERLINRTDIITMSDDHVVVRSDLAKKVFDWNGPAVNPLLTTNRT